MILGFSPEKPAGSLNGVTPAKAVQAGKLPSGIVLAIAAAVALSIAWSQPGPVDSAVPAAEFHFLRLEYVDTFQGRTPFGRGWWRQDWPEAEEHFAEGVKRLTRIDVGDGRHLPLTDDRIFEYPWVYATQVGYWELTRPEVDRLRDYLLRGGFLVVDDFFGPQDWEVFRQTMDQVFPGRGFVDIEPEHPMMHVLYDIDERTFIAGLRHLRRRGGQVIGEPPQGPPEWRGMLDDKGRVVVAVNFNQDVGDAWEHADMPEYPEQMTGLAYRFGLNYIIYAMTH